MFGEKHVDHLMTVLSNHYTISSDCTGSRYLGLDLDWDHEKHKVHLSMLLYVQEALTRFHHSSPPSRNTNLTPMPEEPMGKKHIMQQQSTIPNS